MSDNEGIIRTEEWTARELTAVAFSLGGTLTRRELDPESAAALSDCLDECERVRLRGAVQPPVTLLSRVLTYAAFDEL